jgi:AcrR family transcriptional regulator
VSRATLTNVVAGRGSKLPRGPNALPPEVVLAHQRERLMGATADAVAELGYAELTVGDLISRAGVSRRTFYQLFDGKLECMLAAHRAALDRLTDAIAEACSGQFAWPDSVAAAIDGALEFAVRSPNEVRLALIPYHTVPEPKLMEAARAGNERFEGLLRSGRKRSRGTRVLSELTEPALVGAVTAIVGGRLSNGEVDGLRQLGPELVQIILAPYLGYEEAQRVAHAAAA